MIRQVSGIHSASGVLESWQSGCRQVELILASSVGGLWRGSVLEVLIILFVNNHLLLSDQEPERPGRILRDMVIDTPPPLLAEVPHKR